MNRFNASLKKTAALVALPWILLLAGCDMGSYNPIARALDPFEPMGADARAWMRAETTSSQSEASIIILQSGEPNIGEVGSYAYLVVTDVKAPSAVTRTTLTRGTYVISGGDIILSPLVEYSGAYQYDRSPSSFPAPVDLAGITSTAQISYSNPDLTLTSNGVTLNYRKLYGSGGILEYNSTDEERFLILNQMAVYISQIIIPGFGGTGMMKYTTESPFNGIASGLVWVQLSLSGINGDALFDYADQENLPGLVMTNLLGSFASPRGDGYMHGTVESAIDHDMDGTVDVTAVVGYDGLSIEGTIPSAGAYQVDLGSGAVPITWDRMVPGGFDFTLLVP